MLVFCLMGGRKNQQKKEYTRDYRSPVSSSDSVSRIMSANRHKDTKPEILLRKALWSVGLHGYRLHPKGVPGRPDIVFVKHQLAVFVHGCFWHRCPNCKLPLPKTNSVFWKKKFYANQLRDNRKTTQLESLGWKVVTVWECEVNNKLQTKLNDIRIKLSNE
jgi:DNA mismatch endonuclease, patch repair protein